MSDGRATSWTPERRLAFAKHMKARWRDPAYRDLVVRRRRERGPQSSERRAAASVRMKLLNARMRDDEKLKNKCIRGQKRVRRSPAYRAIQSAVMKDIMARPDLRRAARFRLIKLNKDPKVRRRQWASRRRKKRNVT